MGKFYFRSQHIQQAQLSKQFIAIIKTTNQISFHFENKGFITHLSTYDITINKESDQSLLDCSLGGLVGASCS